MVVNQDCKNGANMVYNFASIALPSNKSQLLSLSASSKKTREEAAQAEEELDALRLAVELAKVDQNIASPKVKGKRQDEFEAWNASISRNEAVLAKLQEETSFTVSKLRTESDSDGERQRKQIASIRRIVVPREK